jgi:2-hydroxy-4-carboxymuconate semialdehyde hemiacetal dehydrogenase
MTMHLGEARHLVEVAAQYNRHLTVPHISRYLSGVMELVRRVRAGDAGRLFQMLYRRLWYQRDVGLLFQRPRRWTDTVSWHHTAHAVDLALWLLAEPVECVGCAIGYDPVNQSAVDLSANFVSASGTIVTLVLSYNARGTLLDCVLVGEHALLQLEDFTTLRANGKAVVSEAEALASQRLAYERYAQAVVAGLRGETDMPISGAEILPVMAQLQRMHDLAVNVTLGRSIHPSNEEKL